MRECPEPQKPKVHIRAAHTAIPEDPDEADDEDQDGEKNEAAEESEKEEYTKVDVYDNEWYEQDTDLEQMF